MAWPGVAFIPAAVEILGDGSKLDDQIVRKVFWFNLAPLFAPQPNQSGLLIAHDHPCVRAADEATSIDISVTI